MPVANTGAYGKLESVGEHVLGLVTGCAGDRASC